MYKICIFNPGRSLVFENRRVIHTKLARLMLQKSTDYLPPYSSIRQTATGWFRAKDLITTEGQVWLDGALSKAEI